MEQSLLISQGLVQLCIIEMARNNLGLAHNALHQALILQDDLETRYHYGITLLSLNKTEEAARQFDRMLEQVPDDPKILTERGVIALGLGENKQANAFFEAALQSDPKYTRAASYLEKHG